MLLSVNGYLAITPPVFTKIEADVSGGIARIQQRVELREENLVFGYKFKDTLVSPGDKVIVRGDAGLKAWAKTVYRLGSGPEFVLCPETDVVGFQTRNV